MNNYALNSRETDGSRNKKVCLPRYFRDPMTHNAIDTHTDMTKLRAPKEIDPMK